MTSPNTSSVYTLDLKSHEHAMSQSRGSPFNYRPLSHSSKEVRLLTLLPGKNFSDRVECELIHSSLEENPQYEALSYVWGTADAPETILLHGQAFAVRQNLLDALRHLRSGQERTLWVDAICIDQDNVSERNHQVGQMGSIYSSATRVVSWLGTASFDSALAIDFLADLSSAAATQPRFPEQSVLPACTKKRRKAVQHLNEREYWKRVWIVQEVVLACNIFIMCGNSGIYWEDFVLGVNRSIGEGIAVHLHRQRSNRKNRNGVRLYDILIACENSLCTDPRDKIFAFLGIADDCQGGKLEADYSKSTWDVYEQVVRFLLHASTTPGAADAQYFAHRILRSPIPPLSRLSAPTSGWFWDGYLRGVIHRIGEKIPFQSMDATSHTPTGLLVSGSEHLRTQIMLKNQVQFAITKAELFPKSHHRFQSIVEFASSRRNKAILNPRSDNQRIDDPVDSFRPIFYGAGRMGFASQNVRVGDLVYSNESEATYHPPWSFGFIVRQIPQKSKRGVIMSMARFLSSDVSGKITT
jgi:hypothetical protein